MGNTFGGVLIPNLEPAGLDFFFGLDNTGIDIIATNSSQDESFATLCPQKVTLAQTTANAPFAPFHININQGTFHPINFFLSPDATHAYIVTSDLGVLVYNFSTQSVSRIQLINDATPVAADMTVDGTLVYVAGSDGLLHQLNTVLGVRPIPDLLCAAPQLFQQLLLHGIRLQPEHSGRETVTSMAVSVWGRAPRPSRPGRSPAAWAAYSPALWRPR